MSDILSGIRGLKTLNSLLKTSTEFSEGPIEKGENPLALGSVNPDWARKNIIPSAIELERNLFRTGNKDQEILSLIQKVFLCDEAMRI